MQRKHPLARSNGDEYIRMPQDRLVDQAIVMQLGIPLHIHTPDSHLPNHVTQEILLVKPKPFLPLTVVGQTLRTKVPLISHVKLAHDGGRQANVVNKEGKRRIAYVPQTHALCLHQVMPASQRIGALVQI